MGESIEPIVAQELHSLAFDLVELRRGGSKSRPVLEIRIDRRDGSKVTRQRIDLSDTESFGTRTLRANVDLTNQQWVRFEVWDVAANGAFTQPVWVK